MRRIADTAPASGRVPAPRSQWRWLVGSAAAAVVVAGFTGAFVAARYEARLGQMAREMAASNQRVHRELAALQSELASSRDVIELLRDPGTRVVTLHGQGSSPGALGRVVWNDRAGGHLFVAKLAPPPKNLIAMQPIAQRHRRRTRPRRVALRHNPCLLRRRPAPTPCDPGDHLDATESVTLCCTIMVQNIHARSPRGGPHHPLAVSRCKVGPALRLHLLRELPQLTIAPIGTFRGAISCLHSLP